MPLFRPCLLGATLLLTACGPKDPPVAAVAAVEAPDPEPTPEPEPAPVVEAPPSPKPTRAVCAPWPDDWTPFEDMDLNGDGRDERWYVAPPRIEGSPKKLHVVARTCPDGWIFVYAEVHHHVETMTSTTRGWKDLRSTITYESNGEQISRSWKYTYDGKTWVRGAEL